MAHRPELIVLISSLQEKENYRLNNSQLLEKCANIYPNITLQEVTENHGYLLDMLYDLEEQKLKYQKYHV